MQNEYLNKEAVSEEDKASLNEKDIDESIHRELKEHSGHKNLTMVNEIIMKATLQHTYFLVSYCVVCKKTKGVLNIPTELALYMQKSAPNKEGKTAFSDFIRKDTAKELFSELDKCKMNINGIGYIMYADVRRLKKHYEQ